MTQTFGLWENTPGWLQLLGKQPFRRPRYASWMIGGGWDGYDYADRPTNESAGPLSRDNLTTKGEG